MFVEFSIAFDSIHGENMEQIQLASGLPKEIVSAIKMLYKNKNVMVCSREGDIDIFPLSEDTLAQYIFIINLYDVQKTSLALIKEKHFMPPKKDMKQTIFWWD